jgi:hypothetical protein
LVDADSVDPIRGPSFKMLESMAEIRRCGDVVEIDENTAGG